MGDSFSEFSDHNVRKNVQVWENNWRCVILDSLDGSYLITLVYDIPSSKERHGDGLWLPSYFTSLFGEMSPEGGLRLQAVWT